MNEHGEMQIGELSRLSGVARHTIHYYIKKGILHPPKKTGQTRAWYDAGHLKQLRKLKKVQREYHSPLAFIASRFTGVGDKERLVSSDSRGPSKSAGRGRRFLKGRKVPDPEKKERIIQAGIELFSTKGYYQTSLKDISSYLGVSIGTFYIYFKSKRDLFYQVATQGIKAIVDEIENRVGNEEDVVVRSAQRLGALNEYYLRFNEILTQLRFEVLGRESIERESLEKVYVELTRPFTREIDAALRQGRIRSVDPDLLTFCLMGMCDMLLFRKNLDDKYDLSEIIAFLFDLLDRALSPGPGQPAGGPAAAPAGLSTEEQEFLAGLRQARYNQAKYAQKLGKSRQSLSNYLRRHPRLKQMIEKEKEFRAFKVNTANPFLLKRFE